LEAHPEKTKVVYCKDSNRKGNYPNIRFDFLGYSFQPRLSKDRRNPCFVNFSPAVGNKAAKSIRETLRSWKIHVMSDKSIYDLSRIFNPGIRGWINYYGTYYKSALYPIFNQLNMSLIKWAMRKYKRLRGHQRKAFYWLGRIARANPWLFAHWRFGVKPAAGR
jgi:RNA-directed DNA polymerase